ncbi:hypothetical protein HZZ00_37780 (plasmid) [Streptomyces sp. NEAU-sy36]|uniref:hypothetical protein n=1 Tax=unclassified Streptomyces TaxID=2593676 RepID=UPI0015D6378B|nr:MULTISPECIES: hypothetical protein [unclassified Streptomyces]QLJ06782.1 hypothetical protein HZZ00_37780 [Streptomyces sp. NEAU-sy36]
MAHGDTTDEAAARLGELHQYFREYQATGPREGHASTASASAPMSLGALDHITASVREIAEHTRAANPDAGPLPERVQDSYAWMHENLAGADEADQLRAAALEYRHFLEHCLEQNDTETVRKTVRQQSCPKCGCWGLMWVPETRRAWCTNTECVDKDGFSTSLSLGRLAHARAVAQQEIRQVRAT